MELISLMESFLPLTNPVLKFLIILLIILLVPITLNRLKIPPILGLIVAGAIVGPNGFNLLLRDNGIILSGTAGLLYIMFLAGLEMDLGEFKRNSTKSLVFGLYTFFIPMILGMLVSIYLLNLTLLPAILLSSMFASHTLIAYPILSKFGMSKNRAVNIAVGGTLITDTLALLILAIIIKMTTGEVNLQFWFVLVISLLVFGLIVIYIFPIISRWFLKRYNDNISQFIFILVMVFLGAFLAELAGIEGIIGAFLVGLVLSRLIPSTSPLMNRIEFVGHAVFIPFFLIGVGMLVDYKAFFNGFETIKIALVMTITATTAKFVAAWLTQKTYKLTADERRLVFGLSNAQAAATLAAVLIGYNVIIGETATGEPIRLLSESILNGTIVMILVTCAIATFSTQRGAQNLALSNASYAPSSLNKKQEKILIPISNPATVEELINLGTTIKSKANKNNLFALNIINEENANEETETNANKLLDTALKISSASDNYMHRLIRHDANALKGITSTINDYGISDLILGLHIKNDVSSSFLGNLTEDILNKSKTNTFVYKHLQPLATIKRHLILVPPLAETEVGFNLWMTKVFNITKNTGIKLHFYANETTLSTIKELASEQSISGIYTLNIEGDELTNVQTDCKANDGLIFVMSRPNKPSFQPYMEDMASVLNLHFKANNFILIYPMQ